MEDKKKAGIRATNQDFRRHDQVEKIQEYGLSERAGEEFDEDFRVRVCDLGRYLRGNEHDRLEFASELGSALEEIGFAILEGHGIEAEVFEEAGREVHRLFTGQSLGTKRRHLARRQGSVMQGYFPIEETSDIHPDLVEGWVFCRRAFALPDVSPPPRLEDFWPDPASEAVFRRLVSAEQELILPVMQSILSYLGCDPHLYDERLHRTSVGLRLNYYPPVGKDAARSGAGRLLGHEDVDLFTFLPAPTEEGLQVLNRRNFRWVRLDAPAGTIVLNTGDYMQRITNDRLPSTTHRVSQPKGEVERGRARVSFPMNVYLWEDELLEALPGLGEPRYAPVSAIEFHTKTTAKYYGDDHAVEGRDRTAP